jgi:hypothetical protein
MYVRKNQKGSDCQLVTALNASIYLHEERLIEPNSKEYLKLLEITGGNTGACINIEKSWKDLKITEKNRYNYIHSVDWNDLPLEIKTHDEHYGFHSSCCINYVSSCEAIQVINFEYNTTSKGWIFKPNLELYLHDLNSEWFARSFKKQ